MSKINIKYVVKRYIYAAVSIPDYKTSYLFVSIPKRYIYLSLSWGFISLIAFSRVLLEINKK